MNKTPSSKHLCDGPWGICEIPSILFGGLAFGSTCIFLEASGASCCWFWNQLCTLRRDQNKEVVHKTERTHLNCSNKKVIIYSRVDIE